jgi:DHA2 family multidrug resistance protein
MADATAAPPSMMNAAAAPSERIAPRRLFAFLIMVCGMFMAVLDIQIVSASLTDIQAGLSASSSEVSWVQTAYLIAEVIAIPLSGFLSRALGTRLLFAISAAGFTIASFLCGFATSIEQMILWRAIQGFLGAGMIPTVFASAYTVFPRSKFYIVGPIIGLVATLAPTVGPTVGGYITDALSWHWLFFINIVPGIGITIGVLTLVDFDQPNFKLLDQFDWWGLIWMGGFLGALEYVLEEGPQYEWLQDTSVAICAAVCALSAIAFFWRVLTVNEPIVDIRTFKDRNFAIGCLISFCVGIGLYGLTYMYPRYLAEVRGYSALMIGETMFVSGVAMFLTAPIVGRLMQKVDLRLIIAAGLVIFALGSLQMTWITRDYDFYELLVPQILRGIGMMFAMVPTNTIALGTLAPDRMKNASGLFNLTRNLGGAVGLAVINQVLNDRTDLHIQRLQERVTWGNATAVETLNMFTQGYGDAFFILTIFYFGLSLLVMLLKKPASASAEPAH